MCLFSAQCEASRDAAAAWIVGQAQAWLAAQGITGGLGWAGHEAGQQASLLPALASAGAAFGLIESCRVARTPLGQPYLAASTGAPLAAWGLSFAHDGGVCLCAAARGPHLTGLGVDLVHLPRLRGTGKDRRYLLRLARRILPDEACTALQAQAVAASLDEVRERVAANFALIEAASKALGTGLRLGAGIGSAKGLPLRTLWASRVAPQVEMVLEGEAARRLAELGGAGLAGQWWRKGELLVALALVVSKGGPSCETGAGRAT